MNDTIYIWMLVGVLLLSACQHKKQEISSSSAPNLEPHLYFGQTPPGLTPELFAPEVVSITGQYEYAVSFAPDLKEIYYSGEGEDGIQSVYFSKLGDTTWTTPRKASFTRGKKKNEFEAFVSHNGDRIYFAAYDSIFADEKIWVVDRRKNFWSEAKLLDSPVNEDLVFYPNAAKNGDLYYTNISKMKMYWAPYKEGNYPETQQLGIEFGIHGFISPDQELLLVDAPNKIASGNNRDIHVCFKKGDGSWTTPIALGETINSEFNETCPSLSPDGKYLFFSRYNEANGMSNIYWASAEVIDRVRPEDLDK